MKELHFKINSLIENYFSEEELKEFLPKENFKSYEEFEEFLFKNFRIKKFFKNTLEDIIESVVKGLNLENDKPLLEHIDSVIKYNTDLNEDKLKDFHKWLLDYTEKTKEEHKEFDEIINNKIFSFEYPEDNFKFYQNLVTLNLDLYKQISIALTEIDVMIQYEAFTNIIAISSYIAYLAILRMSFGINNEPITNVQMYTAYNMSGEFIVKALLDIEKDLVKTTKSKSALINKLLNIDLFNKIMEYCDFSYDIEGKKVNLKELFSERNNTINELKKLAEFVNDNKDTFDMSSVETFYADIVKCIKTKDENFLLGSFDELEAEHKEIVNKVYQKCLEGYQNTTKH